MLARHLYLYLFQELYLSQDATPGSQRLLPGLLFLSSLLQ